MMRIGILFGGRSKEREISFAGGRTVYDNLNKSLFEALNPSFAAHFFEKKISASVKKAEMFAS